MRANEPVNRVMSTPILTIDLHDTVRGLLDIVAAYPVHHVPVVDAGRVVGLVSSADILKFKHFLPATQDRRAAALGWKVSRIMHAPAITIGEHESVQRAAELMVANGIHCLPVVNMDDHVIGIVTTTDIMNGILQGPSGNDMAAGTHSDARSAAAAQAVQSGHDPHGIAAGFLQQQSRLQKLEQLLFAAKRYLNAGQDEQLHRALRLAVDQADRSDTTVL